MDSGAVCFHERGTLNAGSNQYCKYSIQPTVSSGSVDKQRGCCEVAEGKYEITLYTSCCNATKGIYYYNTYENHQISGVDMHRENLDSDHPIRYPAIQGEKIHFQN